MGDRRRGSRARGARVIPQRGPFSRPIDHAPDFRPREWLDELPHLDALALRSRGRPATIGRRADDRSRTRAFGGRLRRTARLIAAAPQLCERRCLSTSKARRSEHLSTVRRRQPERRRVAQLTDDEGEAGDQEVSGSGPGQRMGCLIVALDRTALLFGRPRSAARDKRRTDGPTPGREMVARSSPADDTAASQSATCSPRVRRRREAAPRTMRLKSGDGGAGDSSDPASPRIIGIGDDGSPGRRRFSSARRQRTRSEQHDSQRFAIRSQITSSPRRTRRSVHDYQPEQVEAVRARSTSCS